MPLDDDTINCVAVAPIIGRLSWKSADKQSPKLTVGPRRLPATVGQFAYT